MAARLQQAEEEKRIPQTTEPPTVTPVTAVAPPRATPEEIARALAAIDARRQETQKAHEGTIPLENIVEQLGLDVSPEELASEVQAQRSGVVHKSNRQPYLSLAAGRFLIGTTLFGLVFAGICLGLVGIVLTNQHREAKSRSAVTAVNTSAVVVQDIGTDGKPMLRTLSEIPNNHPFRMTLSQVNLGDNQYAILAENFDLQGQYVKPENWQGVKHEGRIYLRAYTPPASDTVLAKHSINLYNSESAMPNSESAMRESISQEVTLPLSALRLQEKDTGLEYRQRLTVTALETDAHLREPWSRDNTHDN